MQELYSNAAEPLSVAGAVEAFRIYTGENGDYVISGEEPMTLDDGREARRLNGSFQGNPHAWILVGHGSRVFAISYGAPPGRWESTEPDMLRMARSFTARS